MSSIVERMIGAATLQVSTFEEVEADESATGEALAVVAMSSLAVGISTLSLTGLIFGTLAALVGWVISAVIIFFVGTKLLPEPQTSSDIGEILRTTGFASSPGILRVVGVIPILGALLSFLIGIWMLVATVVAVRQALDYQSTGRAAVVCIIGFIIQFVIALFLAPIIALFSAFLS